MVKLIRGRVLQRIRGSTGPVTLQFDGVNKTVQLAPTYCVERFHCSVPFGDESYM